MTNRQIPLNQQLNRIGKYLYKNLDGAFKFESSSNMFDVYITLLYQDVTNKDDTVNEMTLDLNLTTYQDKLRINIYEVTPEERTLGSFTVKSDKLVNLSDLTKFVFQRIVKYVDKAYEDYEFIY